MIICTFCSNRLYRAVSVLHAQNGSSSSRWKLRDTSETGSTNTTSQTGFVISCISSRSALCT